MAKGANLKDAILLLAVGRDNAIIQQTYFEQQAKSRVKHRGAQVNRGRAYHSFSRADALDDKATATRMMRAPQAIVRLITAPFRAVMTIGHYDVEKTR